MQDGDAVYNVKITRLKDGMGKAWLKNVDTQQEITLERRPKMQLTLKGRSVEVYGLNSHGNLQLLPQGIQEQILAAV